MPKPLSKGDPGASTAKEHSSALSQALRIRLAHLFDPVLAVHTSVVEPLPHQITAVYDAMLPRQPIGFLLAGDPGAGKSIIAGLLMKELIARGVKIELDPFRNAQCSGPGKEQRHQFGCADGGRVAQGDGERRESLSHWVLRGL
jgi:hypothetical protein